MNKTLLEFSTFCFLYQLLWWCYLKLPQQLFRLCDEILNEFRLLKYQLSSTFLRFSKDKFANLTGKREIWDERWLWFVTNWLWFWFVLIGKNLSATECIFFPFQKTLSMSSRQNPKGRQLTISTPEKTKQYS